MTLHCSSHRAVPHKAVEQALDAANRHKTRALAVLPILSKAAVVLRPHNNRASLSHNNKGFNQGGFGRRQQPAAFQLADQQTTPQQGGGGGFGQGFNQGGLGRRQQNRAQNDNQAVAGGFNQAVPGTTTSTTPFFGQGQQGGRQAGRQQGTGTTAVQPAFTPVPAATTPAVAATPAFVSEPATPAVASTPAPVAFETPAATTTGTTSGASRGGQGQFGLGRGEQTTAFSQAYHQRTLCSLSRCRVDSCMVLRPA